MPVFVHAQNVENIVHATMPTAEITRGKINGFIKTKYLCVSKATIEKIKR